MPRLAPAERRPSRGEPTKGGHRAGARPVPETEESMDGAGSGPLATVTDSHASDRTRGRIAYWTVVPRPETLWLDTRSLSWRREA